MYISMEKVDHRFETGSPTASFGWKRKKAERGWARRGGEGRGKRNGVDGGRDFYGEEHKYGVLFCGAPVGRLAVPLIYRLGL